MKASLLLVLLSLISTNFYYVVKARALVQSSTVSVNQSGAQYSTIQGQRSPRQFDGEGNDEEDEEDEETTVKGPGHEGILTGLSGIFSNLVKGNANGIVESTFNFVPPVYQKEVSSAYGTIVGKTTTTTTPPPRVSPTRFPPSGAGGVRRPDDESEREVVPPPPLPPLRRRPPKPTRPVSSGVIFNRPFGERPSTGDDEEDEELPLRRQRPRPVASGRQMIS